MLDSCNFTDEKTEAQRGYLIAYFYKAEVGLGIWISIPVLILTFIFTTFSFLRP